MEIIVVQKHYNNLEGIRNEAFRLDPLRAERIFFTSSPQAVLAITKRAKSAFVVSGQMLGDWGSDYEGTDLAKDVKKACSNSLFIIYSTVPLRNEYVDGIIKKGEGLDFFAKQRLLAKILVSNLDSATKESLKADFPEVEIT